MQFTVTPIKDETAKLIGMAAVMRDVTKQFQEMRALKRKLDERLFESISDSILRLQRTWRRDDLRIPYPGPEALAVTGEAEEDWGR